VWVEGRLDAVEGKLVEGRLAAVEGKLVAGLVEGRLYAVEGKLVAGLVEGRLAAVECRMVAVPVEGNLAVPGEGRQTDVAVSGCNGYNLAESFAGYKIVAGCRLQVVDCKLNVAVLVAGKLVAVYEQILTAVRYYKLIAAADRRVVLNDEVDREPVTTLAGDDTQARVGGAVEGC